MSTAACYLLAMPRLCGLPLARVRVTGWSPWSRLRPMTTERPQRDPEPAPTGSEATGLELLLEALHAAAMAGDAQAAWALRFLRQSLH